MAKSDAATKAVGADLSSVLPQDGLPWYRKPHLVKLHLCVLALILFASANGYDGSLMNGLQALPQWQEHMDTPSGAWLGFINAIYYVGTASNSPIAAFVANKYGRKAGIYTGYTMLFLGVALCGPNSDIAFLMSRFFIGCSTAWFTNAVPLLLNEIAYPTHRGIVSALFMSGWYVGGTLAAVITFGTRNMQSNWAWRIPTICQLVIPMIALPGLLMSPESPRWLISMNRTEEARVVLQNIHAGEDTNSPLVDYEVSEISNAITIEREISASASYMDMIKTRGNRHRLFISVSLGIFSQWCGNGVVSYYLAMVLTTVGITSVTDQTLISVGLNAWNLLWSVAAAFSVDRLGRRPLFFASVGTMLVGYVIVTGLSGAFAQSGQSATGIAVIPFLFVFFAGYDLAMTPFLSAYPCEIWPYSLRSRGLTVTWCSAFAAIFFNTFINPIALEAIAWKYYLVFVAVLIVMGFVVYFYYPETRGHTLEQMAVLFDGDEADTSPSAYLDGESIHLAENKDEAGVAEKGR